MDEEGSLNKEMYEMKYIETIRRVIMDMIINEEIDYDYAHLESIDSNEDLQLSSMDKVKVIIELELQLNISIDDSLLGKLDTLEDFEKVLLESM